MCGCLQRRARKQWKRSWFVLRDRVLYMYRASQDVVAVDSLPVLGYQLQTLSDVSATPARAWRVRLRQTTAAGPPHPACRAHVQHALCTAQLLRILVYCSRLVS